MSRILVLGGSGFIGHQIVRELLERGEKVSVMVRPGSDTSLLEGMEVDLVEGDIDRSGDIETALDGADALVHAAAYYPIYSLGRDSQKASALHQVGRIHKALARKNVRRYLYVSTLSAVGRYEDGRPEDENAPFPVERLKSTYASLKRAMQEEVLRQANRFNTVVVAPTAVFGSGDRKPTTGRVILETAKRKMPVILKGKMNAVDVQQVAWGVAEALQKGKSGKLYVLGGENMTLEGFFARVARIAEVPAPRFALPTKPLYPIAWTTEVAGKLLRAERPLLPVVGIDFAHYGEYMSSEVAERELDYDPMKTSVDAAIRNTITWFRDHHYLPARVIL